jgi:hypothetical protein
MKCDKLQHERAFGECHTSKYETFCCLIMHVVKGKSCLKAHIFYSRNYWTQIDLVWCLDLYRMLNEFYLCSNRCNMAPTVPNLRSNLISFIKKAHPTSSCVILCCLFRDADTKFACVASIDWWITNWKGRRWKRSWPNLSHSSFGWEDGKDENKHQSGEQLFGPRPELRPSRIWSRTVTHLTTAFGLIM